MRPWKLLKEILGFGVTSAMPLVPELSIFLQLCFPYYLLSPSIGRYFLTTTGMSGQTTSDLFSWVELSSIGRRTNR